MIKSQAQYDIAPQFESIWRLSLQPDNSLLCFDFLIASLNAISPNLEGLTWGVKTLNACHRNTEF